MIVDITAQQRQRGAVIGLPCQRRRQKDAALARIVDEEILVAVHDRQAPQQRARCVERPVGVERDLLEVIGAAKSPHQERLPAVAAY